jgi:hypothetical protein
VQEVRGDPSLATQFSASVPTLPAEIDATGVKRQLEIPMATIRNAHGGWLKDTHFWASLIENYV